MLPDPDMTNSDMPLPVPRAIHNVICPVCRTEHQITSAFLSSPRYMADSKNNNRPAVSCGKHTREEVQDSYWNV